jgi:hypothetical protein
MGHATVVSYLTREPTSFAAHEAPTRAALGRMIAALQEATYAGTYEPGCAYEEPLYFVPTDTLTRDTAAHLGIHSPLDLYGGVAPYEFVPTKVIVHPLVGPGADRPPGWSDAFAEAVHGFVVPGYTAFHHDDARIAARRLLVDGPIRLKRPRAAGGRGQIPVATAAEANEALEGIDADELGTAGLVIETNLRSVRTFSVGQASVGGLTVSYYGQQRESFDHTGEAVYAGSDLVVYHGGFDTLLRRPLMPIVRHAVVAALAFDQATHHYEGLFASRRNYDVGHGLTARGRRVLGVFEQSWRIGGASGAELLALQAFREDPGLRRVEASTVEVYGVDHEIPAAAEIHFQSSDASAGPLACYSLLRRAAAAAA